MEITGEVIKPERERQRERDRTRDVLWVLAGESLSQIHPPGREEAGWLGGSVGNERNLSPQIVSPRNKIKDVVEHRKGIRKMALRLLAREGD